MLNVVRIADGIMRANKRIPVSEDTWRELARIKEAGQAYDRLLRELIWEKKKKRLEEDAAEWEKDGSVEFSFH